MVAQEPADAEYDTTPHSALSQVKVGHIVCAHDLAAPLKRLASEPL